ncbi:hypothetical protein IT408_03525, partial [Candidatus Uhrbacteria bacterium]|nr:hypothetical protein [Candidatus Uhrbacteria bacterium]
MATLSSLLLSGVIPFGFSANQVSAAIPNIVNYQSRLRSNTLAPITALTNIQFTLYTDISLGTPAGAAAPGGPVLWKEIHDGVTCSQILPDADGYFSVQLGACIPFPSYITWNQPLYLGVKISSDAEANPRVLLGAHQYALNSQAVNGFTASTTAQANSILALDNSQNFNIATGTFIGAGLNITNTSTLQQVSFTNATGSSLNLSNYLSIGAIRLDQTGTSNLTSGAYLVGVFDEFTNSNATTVQAALRDLDLAISAVSSTTSTETLQTITNRGNSTTNTIQFAGGTSTGSLLVQNNFTVTGNSSLQDTTMANATAINVTSTNLNTTGLSVLGSVNSNLIPTLDAFYVLGTSAFRWNGVFANTTSTNATSTNFFATNLSGTNGNITNLSFVGATGTWLNSTTVTSTNIFANTATFATATVMGQAVCLTDGTGCPAATSLNNETLAVVTGRGATTTQTLQLMGGFLASSSTVTSTFTVLGGTSLQNLTFVNATGSSLNLSNYLSIGAIRLDQTGTSNLTSGAYLVGVFDEFTNSNATTVQAALRDLDLA